MRKMRKSKWICLVALLFVFMVNAVFAIVAIAENNTRNYVWDEIQLDDEYLVGDTFVVPAVDVSLGETEYKTEFSLRFPDGKSYTDADGNNATESEFILTQAGIYTLKYSARIDSEILSKTMEFTVKETLYSVSSEKSQVVYGEVSYPNVDGTDDITKTGLSVKLAAGDTFHYNKIVDLSKKDSLQNVLTFSVLPQVDRELDISGITVILTDAYDAENSVEIKVKAIVNAAAQWSWNSAYTSACAPKAGQVTTGFSPGSVPEVQVNTIYGRSAWFPFYGSDWDKTSSAIEHSLTLNYDYAQKQVYVGTALVADLDDSSFFKQKLWSGFTTGEVFVSVVGNTYYKDSAHLLITELCGETIEENEILEKDSEPKITLDTMGIDLENPISVVGYKFPVFKATAIDAYDGNLPVTVRVYNGYYSSNRNELDIVNDYFTADRLGVVTLEYCVQKKNGKVYKKLVNVQVREESVLDVVVSTNRVTSGTAGDIIPLPEYTVKGNVGDLSTAAQVFLGGEKITVTNGAFKAEGAGEYEIRISAKDVIGQYAETSYTLLVSENLTPVFFGDTIVPKYFIVGKTYTLPKFSAYDYSTNSEKEIQTTLKINGVEGATFTPNSAGDVTVEYTAQTAVGVASKTYQSKAVDVKTASGELDFSKYFDTKNLTTSVDNIGVDFTAKTAGEDAETTFINYLNSYDFSVEFAVNSAKASFGTIDVYLTDVTNASKAVKISINLLSNKAVINGKQTNIAVNGDLLFDTTGKSSVRLALDARTGILSIGSATYPLDGFADFSGSLLSLRFVLTDIKGDAEFSVRKIGNQVIKSTIKKDTISPVVLYNGSYDIYKNAGEILTVYKAVISDVLTPIVESYVSVKTPDGGFAVAKDGTVMNKAPSDKDYQIELSAYGSYRVDYYAKDGAGQKASGTTSTLQVIDKIPPVIVVDGGTPKTAKIGDKIQIPSYTITDNKDSEFTVTVILMNSFEGLRKVWKEKEFVVNEEGTYIITILCYDKAGNMASATVKVKVEA